MRGGRKGDAEFGKQGEGELKGQNRIRAYYGLKLLEEKVRCCLRCGGEFTSTGNRLCQVCKRENLPFISGTEIY